MEKMSAALLSVALMLGLASAVTAADKKGTMAADAAKAKQAYSLGVQAYIWGYPMVVAQQSRDAMTKGGDAPVTPDEFNKTGNTNLH